MMKKGFTLTELLMVVVIIAALAAISLPRLTTAAEKAKAKQAVAYLRVIRTGEKMYYARNEQYIACADKAAIKANIGAEVTEDDYTFRVTTGAGNSTFYAIAKRKTNNQTIRVNQSGDWSGTYTKYIPAE